MRKITQTIVGTTPPLDKNVIWLDSTDNTAPVEKVFINGQWTPMGIDTDDYYTKEEINDKLDEKLDVIETPVNGNLIAMNSQGQAIDSGKKTTDFIANPTSEGQEGEVLSVDSEGNPVWTTVTPTGTADTEMSDTSTNAVQNKVIKSYVDDNCAKKDGYYSTLTAGAAENLVGQSVDSEAYLIRPTGSTENEVANGVASVLGMEGNSCVWNQSIYGTVQYSNIGIQLSSINNKFTVTGEATASAGFNIMPRITTIVGHKYYVYLKGSHNFNAFVFRNISFPTLKPTLFTEFQTTNNVAPYITVTGGQEYSASFTYYLIDLTLLGIDNLTTVAQVEAWLAEHVGTKPYYAYNAGTILSAQTLGIKTYGQNLLNPTTKQAELIPYTWVENSTDYSNQYTIKNVPSGATATFTPDNTGVAESVTITDDIFDITSYGSGVLELSAATANTYVCIRWNGTKDNDVVPYEDHTYDFDVRKVYGKVSGAGEYVQCFPNGMKSAGSVHDILTASEAVVKLGNVDLGTLNWRLNTNGYFCSNVINTVIPSTTGVVPNILTTKYLTSNNYEVTNNEIEDTITIGRSGTSFEQNVVIMDSSYSDATTFKASLTGVPLYYELATPITYTNLIYRDNGVDTPLADVLMNITVNNWSMEEQLMTPYNNGNPTSIPATIKTQYGMDAVEAIDTLQKTSYFADDVHANLQALLTCINTNCAETLGGTFSVSDTATEKVFEFTFTPNTEPDVEPTNEGE